MTKILAFAGSSKKTSYNRQLVNIAAAGAESAGAQVTLVDLADFPMPLMNEDLEAEHGLPEKAREFKQLLREHDGWLIASPEYNGAFSPLMKNVLDWASRAETQDEPPLSAYQGKVAAVMAASPGGLGGLRGLVLLRILLGNLGVTVLPEQQTVSQAFKAFAEDGSLAEERKQTAVTALGAKLVQTVQKLKTNP